MKLNALLLVITSSLVAVAEEPRAGDIPEQYAKFQGEWVLDVPAESSDDGSPPEIVVTVTGNHFRVSGPTVDPFLSKPLELAVPRNAMENPYRWLRKRGVRNMDEIVDVDNQITVFWFVGIYEFVDDELHLALKYCGQGLEGEHFLNFRPPVSFAGERMEDETRLVLRRRKGQPNPLAPK